VQPLGKSQLVIVESEIRKDLILGKEIIAPQRRFEKVKLNQFLLLAESIQEEIELCLKGVATHIGVELRDKWVLLWAFQQLPGLQPLGQQLCKTRLADADRALDNDATGVRHGPLLRREAYAVVGGAT